VPFVGLCLPLRARNQLIGVLEAYGLEDCTEKETVQSLESLATQVASALENAQLYEELAEREHQLRDLVGRMVLAQEEERHRVAYDIHDSLAQLAVAAHQHLQAFRRNYPPDSARGQEELDRALDLVQQTVREARNIISDLRPPALDDFGLVTALQQQVEEFCSEDCRISYAQTLGDERLPVEVETALFRVAQEALTNVRKHAHSARVQISLERLEGAISLQVRDWGQGIQPDAMTGGDGRGERVGLSGMRERIALLGGDFDIRSERGVGTLIVATIPLLT
jgi:signal transduction histidine kinase